MSSAEVTITHLYASILIVTMILPNSFLKLFIVKLWPSRAPNTGEGNGTPLQYSCLENPMDGGAW